MKPFGAVSALAVYTSLAALALAPPPAVADVALGFVEDWSDGTEAGWDSFAENSNPGTGGFHGSGDGFLRVARTGFPGNLGSKSNSLSYVGNWRAVGATQVHLALNDIEANEDFEIHVAIGNISNMWQYNVGFAPPENSWASFIMDLSDSTQFSHIVASDGMSFSAAIQNVDRLLIRHDKPPFDQSPAQIQGAVGIDHLQIPAVVGVDLPLAGGRDPVWLAPPSPNPSRGAVTCAVETSDAGPVRLSVHDATGRIVRTASLAAASPGRRVWMWDGLDGNGRRVVPGVYRVRAVGVAGGTSRNLVRLP